MKVECNTYNGYSKAQIREKLNIVKAFPRKTENKNVHRTRLHEIKGLYYDLVDINQRVFEPDLEYNFMQYKNTVVIYESMTKIKKTHLDLRLQLCLRYLEVTLESILKNNF